MARRKGRKRILREAKRARQVQAALLGYNPRILELWVRFQKVRDEVRKKTVSCDYTLEAANNNIIVHKLRLKRTMAFRNLLLAIKQDVRQGASIAITYDKLFINHVDYSNLSSKEVVQT